MLSEASRSGRGRGAHMRCPGGSSRFGGAAHRLQAPLATPRAAGTRHPTKKAGTNEASRAPQVLGVFFSAVRRSARRPYRRDGEAFQPVFRDRPGQFPYRRRTRSFLPGSTALHRVFRQRQGLQAIQAASVPEKQRRCKNRIDLSSCKPGAWRAKQERDRCHGNRPQMHITGFRT